MENQLRNIEILGGTFLIDRTNNTLTELNRPSNSFSMGLPDTGGTYEFLFDKNTHTLFEGTPEQIPNGSAIRKIRIHTPESTHHAQPNGKPPDDTSRYRSATQLLNRIMSAFQPAQAEKSTLKI